MPQNLPTGDYKTFLATSQLVSGVIRVVIVRFDDGGGHLNQCDLAVCVLDMNALQRVELRAAVAILEGHDHSSENTKNAEN